MKVKTLIVGEFFAVLLRAVIYSICVFILVDDFTGTKWCAYAFTLLAVVLQMIGPLIAAGRGKAGKDNFITLPIIICGETYFFLQFLAGIVLMVIDCPLEWSFLIQLVLLAAYIFIFGSLISGKDYLDASETKVTDYAGSFHSIISKSEALYLKEADFRKKQELKKLYEALRYSDPISRTYELQEMDKRIEAALTTIYAKVEESSLEQVKIDVGKMMMLITERNSLCKDSKK